MAIRVIVKGRRWWQERRFHSDYEIGVSISNEGLLTITSSDNSRAVSFNPHYWTTVESTIVPSKAKV